MSDDASPPGFSLRRWSQRKRAAAPGETRPESAPADDSSAAPMPAPTRDASARAPEGAALPGVPALPAGAGMEGAPLPPVESLTPESDFTPFMQVGVDPALRSAALRKLFADPQFNVMDGLDVYIGDYSKPDPISPDVVKTLWQARGIFWPTETRVNAEGCVEDVPPDERVGAAADAPPAALDGTRAPEAPAAAAPPPEEVLAAAANDDAPHQVELPLDDPQEAPPT